jgi:hypothetical protein
MPLRAPVFPSTLLIQEISPGDCLVGFRTVRLGEIGHPDLWKSFRSHYEEGLEPRYQQTQHAALHFAVSFWRDRDVALALAKRFPSHGNYLARVLLRALQGFNFLDQSAEYNPMHLTIWGQPVRLAEAVVDIIPIGES